MGRSHVVKSTKVVFVLVSFLLMGFGVVPLHAGEKELKVGCIMPFTGPAAPWGLAIRPQMEIFAELVNEDGGLKIGANTYKVKMFFADGQYMPAPGAKAARDLIFRNDVSAILGYFGAGMSAISPITNKEKVIFICRTGSGVTYSPEKDPYVVFGTPSNEMVFYQAVAAMKGYPKFKKLCFTGPTAAAKQFSETDNQTLDKDLKEKYGIEVVRIFYPEGTKNFTPYIAKMKEAGVELVSVGGNVLEVALLAKQRWEAGLKWPITETGTLIDPALFVQLSGAEAAQGICSDRPAPWELKTVKVAPRYLKTAERIKARYEKKFGKPLTYTGSFGWGLNHMSQYFEALQQAGTIDPDKVMAKFRGGTFETFLGKYTTSGAKIYGSPVVFGYPCAMGIIKGKEEVYLGENPLRDVNDWLTP